MKESKTKSNIKTPPKEGRRASPPKGHMTDKTKFTQKELMELGFEKVTVPKEDNDGINTYVYFTLEFNDNNYTHCLITDAFEKGVKELGVQLFEGDKYLSIDFIRAVKKEFGI